MNIRIKYTRKKIILHFLEHFQVYEIFLIYFLGSKLEEGAVELSPSSLRQVKSPL